MSASTVKDKTQVMDAPEVVSGAVQDPFDLDVDVLELAGGTVPLITLTDDSCKPSCPAPSLTPLGETPRRDQLAWVDERAGEPPA